MIEQVGEVQGQLHAVAFAFSATAAQSGNAAARPTLTAAAHSHGRTAGNANLISTPTGTPATTAITTAASAGSGLTLLILVVAVGSARRSATKTPGFADTHVNGEEPRAFTVVAWNQSLTKCRVAIEVAKRRASDIWIVAIRVRGCERRPLSEETIQIGVLAGSDVERSS